MLHIDAGLRHSLIGSQHGVLDERSEAARLLLGEARLQRIIAGNAANHIHIELLALFFGQKVKAALSCRNLAPQRLYAETGRGNRAHAGNNDALKLIVLLNVAHSDIPPSIAKTCPVI